MKKPAKELIWIWVLLALVVAVSISECKEDGTAMIEPTAIEQTV